MYTSSMKDFLEINTRRQQPILHRSCGEEHMFDKVVTPSDVGKLNRLVVPKQHAERYFPAPALAGTTTQLRFEDRAGTPWLFRYSFWGSSQSYVMTKGWSRFVKEKRLAAGDTVSFSRSSDGRGSRYFVDFRHRQPPRRREIVFGRVAAGSNDATSTVVFRTVLPVGAHVDGVASPAAVVPRSFRLFGVNVECGGDDEVQVGM